MKKIIDELGVNQMAFNKLGPDQMDDKIFELVEDEEELVTVQMLSSRPFTPCSPK